MLGPGRYLLGVAELLFLVGFAWLGALFIRRRLVAELDRLPAQLATAVIALALLVCTAELLGSFGLFEPLPYLCAVAILGSVLWLRAGGGRGGPSGAAAPSPSPRRRLRAAANSPGEKPSKPEEPPQPLYLTTLVALLIAIAAVVHFAVGVKARLSTGMTGFDSTWYHGPFAAGFFQSGNTWDLHFIAPQFLAWFYPANSEVLHAVGMAAFHRDLLSPLLNLGWFVGCLAAGWCIGRPYRAAPWSMALVAIALSVPALSDQAGEARNDIVGIFFLLAAVAVALNAWGSRPGSGDGAIDAEESEAHGSKAEAGGGLSTGALVVASLAAGLAAGTKLNFLLPAGVLVVGLALISPQGPRWRALATAGLAALAGGGYWYLRNLSHTGNPLPWVKHLGPIALPAPEQALGGREGHSVLGYLTNGSVWSDWLLPGLHHGLTIFWPVLGALALAGLLLCLGRRARPVQRVAALAALAAALAWLVAPTSASGPDGFPHGFESGLRYLAPALILGLALLPTTPGPWPESRFCVPMAQKRDFARPVGLAVCLTLLAAAIGYPIQRHYLQSRYADPTFSAPGLDAAFSWAQGISDARIATTGTRQYPLFGRDLSNEVAYVGEEQPHGGFAAPTTCRAWRNLLNAGHYDYVVTTRDRLEPGKPVYPPSTSWTAGSGATVVLRRPPTIVFRLRTELSPAACKADARPGRSGRR